jgi:hypothetical protein
VSAYSAQEVQDPCKKLATSCDDADAGGSERCPPDRDVADMLRFGQALLRRGKQILDTPCTMTALPPGAPKAGLWPQGPCPSRYASGQSTAASCICNLCKRPFVCVLSNCISWSLTAFH